MFFLLCLFTVVFGLCCGSVIMFLFAGIAIDFFPVLMYFLETLITVVYFWGEIVTYIAFGILEAVQAFLKLCTHMAPFILRGVRHVSNSFPYIINDLLYHFHQVRVNLWNFIRYRSEWLIFCWSLLLVLSFSFSNQLRNIFQRNGLNNPNRNRRERVDDSDNDDHDNNLYEYRRTRNNAGGQNIRIRQGIGRQRLDSQVPDEHSDNEAMEDNYEHVGNQNSNLQCIVCFEHDRNTAVFPCGHTQTCRQCTRNVMMTSLRCPICQRLIAEYRTIYL